MNYKCTTLYGIIERDVQKNGQYNKRSFAEAFEQFLDNNHPYITTELPNGKKVKLSIEILADDSFIGYEPPFPWEADIYDYSLTEKDVKDALARTLKNAGYSPKINIADKCRYWNISHEG